MLANRLRHFIASAGLAALALPTTAFAAGAGGVTGPAFYANGDWYRTVGTPTDFSGTGAPDHSFDVIYAFGGVQANVADAAPGLPGYNGGRWQVHALSFTAASYAAALADAAVDMNGNDVLDSADEVEAGISAGYLSDAGVVKNFECPAIKLPGGGR